MSAFNPGNSVRFASVPLTEIIGLTGGSRLSVDEIITASSKRLGAYNRNEDIVFQRKQSKMRTNVE